MSLNILIWAELNLDKVLAGVVRRRARLMRAASLAAGALMLCAAVAGCGRGRSVNPALQTLNGAAGQALGSMISADTDAGGKVVLIHRSENPEGIEAWIQGLAAGLSDPATKIVQFGPGHMSDASRNSMGGFPGLREAMERHPEARALVTALSIGAFERPEFPPEHAPVYALDWSDVGSAAFLFRRPDLAGGVFLRPDYTPAPIDPEADPETILEQMYVLVNPGNIRDMMKLYPRE